ncbi:26S proteasome regulatory subunit 8 [Microbotryomycetes sp. JL201]|nr:26S proteasome regulatory subunit 8 [Microbotryomycetes sp. JL201]
MPALTTPAAPVDLKQANSNKDAGVTSYFQSKIEAAELLINAKTQNLRRLEAQRNALNARVRLLREELQLLQESGSYVGEVVKVMGKKKVLVKIQPEGKYVVDFAQNIDLASLTPNLRVALRSDSYQLHSILPTKQDPLVALMMVEKVPDSTYEMVGGLDQQIKEIKEVIELPVKHPELFDALGIAQPKGVLLYGPPGTGKTLLARAVAHHTDCKFIRVSGSELVQKYIGEGSRMVRELFVMAREHAPSIIFMDEIDSIGSSRGESGSGGGDSEVQRTMLELLNQLDGFEATKNIKVIMATNRIDILDSALLRPGRIDRKIEFPPPGPEARVAILRIHSRKMSLQRGINLRALAEKMGNCSGAEVRGICTEAGMYALRERRQHVTQEDFEMSIAKVLRKAGDSNMSSNKTLTRDIGPLGSQLAGGPSDIGRGMLADDSGARMHRSGHSAAASAAPVRRPAAVNVDARLPNEHMTKAENGIVVVPAPHEGGHGGVTDSEQALGCLSDDEYRRLMPQWRYKVRKQLVKVLHHEMNTLEWIQTFRTPFLDDYFLKSSLLGTHTFFMIGLPLPCWFGRPDISREMLIVLACGGYVTSVLKDLFCVPRPYSPPMVRLSVGTHALEYGFPSTHSCTTVSMALFLGTALSRTYPDALLTNQIAHIALGFITMSVIVGRVYAGMHSITDCVVGFVTGSLVWLVWWTLEDFYNWYTLSEGWLLTCTSVPLVLFLVFVHPAPAEDCPCFEDAVAFLSATLGTMLGRNWYQKHVKHITYGATLSSPLRSTIWLAAIVLKLVLGIASIFVWRIVAKAVCHAILPKLFRFFRFFLLPRRFYLQATEYDGYDKADSLHPVPSILDLPSLPELKSPGIDDPRHVQLALSSSTAVENHLSAVYQVKKPSGLRHGVRKRSGTNGSVIDLEESDESDEATDMLAKDRVKFAVLHRDKDVANEYVSDAKRQQQQQQPAPNAAAVATTEWSNSTAKQSRKRGASVGSQDGDTVRKDADVLTKVIVYAGIGWLTTIYIPLAFEKVGLSIQVD